MALGESLGEERPHDAVEEQVEPKEDLGWLRVSALCDSFVHYEVRMKHATAYGSDNVLNHILGKVKMKNSGDPLREAGRQVRRGPTA